MSNIIIPNDKDGHSDDTSTERSKERAAEERQFERVIIKRTDEFQRHPDDVLEFAIQEGTEQLNRPILSLLLSAIAAGLILAFTSMAVAVVTTALLPFDQPLLQRIAVALVYPFGFVACVMSGAQLFTEHTAMAVYPVLDRKAPVQQLLKVWAVVLIGNLIGAAISAWMLVMADSVIHAKVGYIEIGHHLVGFAAGPLIISSILAGWLMALGGWLLFATPLGVSQVVCIYIVTFLIGIGGLHHSIAGSVEMFCALFISDVYTIAQSARFISLAVIGNLIGGSIFVALLNYGHIRHTQTEQGKLALDN